MHNTPQAFKLPDVYGSTGGELHPERIQAVSEALSRYGSDSETPSDRVLLWFDCALNASLVALGKREHDDVCNCECCKYAAITIKFHEDQVAHFKNDAKTWCGEYVKALAALNKEQATNKSTKKAKSSFFKRLFGG